jgi:hypothetical protein
LETIVRERIEEVVLRKEKTSTHTVAPIAAIVRKREERNLSLLGRIT